MAAEVPKHSPNFHAQIPNPQPKFGLFEEVDHLWLCSLLKPSSPDLRLGCEAEKQGRSRSSVGPRFSAFVDH